MGVAVKICGLKSEAAVDAASAGGAAYIGFVFYSASPRAVSFTRAAELSARIPRPTLKCGLFVDATAETIYDAVDRAGLDLIQLHGRENPDFADAIRRHTNLPTMKAFAISRADDLAATRRWIGAVDMVLFDAKPPATPDALPGGNGVRFDWQLLAGFDAPLPWMLSGGVNSDNIEEAVQLTGARTIDVSSGVESRPGVKDPRLITGLLDRARGIEPRGRR